MKIYLPIVLLVSFVFSSCGLSRKSSKRTDAMPITHELWTNILQDHVNEKGWFDYKKLLADRSSFDEYLALLGSHHPNPDTWSESERKAYWINAYNAYTVELILQNYPLESIKDIKGGIPFVNGVWDIEFIDIEETAYNLNNIEHGILRKKFPDPRIHMAVNCASYSCPKLQDVAFEAGTLEEQLDAATRTFLTDDLRNNIDPQTPEVSSIFKWFNGDFTKKENQTLIEFLNKYLDQPISTEASVTYLEYDWRLNDTAQRD